MMMRACVRKYSPHLSTNKDANDYFRFDDAPEAYNCIEDEMPGTLLERCRRRDERAWSQPVEVRSLRAWTAAAAVVAAVGAAVAAAVADQEAVPCLSNPEAVSVKTSETLKEAAQLLCHSTAAVVCP